MTQFQAISHAYEILSDPLRKASYDSEWINRPSSILYDALEMMDQVLDFALQFNSVGSQNHPGLLLCRFDLHFVVVQV